MSFTHECSICYEVIRNDANIIITKCNHTFHASCIASHLLTRCGNYQYCPICRAHLSSGEYVTTAAEPNSDATAADDAPGNSEDEEEDEEAYDGYLATHLINKIPPHTLPNYADLLTAFIVLENVDDIVVGSPNYRENLNCYIRVCQSIDRAKSILTNNTTTNPPSRPIESEGESET